MEAKPLDDVPRLIRSIAAIPDTTVAVISGRPVAEINELLGKEDIYVAGSHGFELQHPDGRLDVFPPTLLQAEGLRLATKAMIRLSPNAPIETKIGSIALHTRGLSTSVARHLEAEAWKTWSSFAANSNLQCRYFDGGLELRALGRHKGDIIDHLLTLLPAGTASVYIGDDETDEDAFRTVATRGVGIIVGPGNQRTSAGAVLPDCTAVRTFLETWLVMARQRSNKTFSAPS